MGDKSLRSIGRDACAATNFCACKMEKRFAELAGPPNPFRNNYGHTIGTSFQRPASEQGTIDCLAILANTTIREKVEEMKTLTAKDAKYGFGQLIDLARTAPVE